MSPPQGRNRRSQARRWVSTDSAVLGPAATRWNARALLARLAAPFLTRMPVSNGVRRTCAPDQPVDLFGESLPSAFGRWTQQPPDLQDDLTGPVADRGHR